MSVIAVNYSSVRNNFKKYCDAAVHDFETIIVTRKRNENVIIISEAEYNKLIENNLSSDMDNSQRLLVPRPSIERRNRR